jgi:polysaccharide export outer membrane protein
MIPPLLNKFLPVNLSRTGAIALSGLSLTGFFWVIPSESPKLYCPLSIPQTQPGAGLEFLPPQPPNPTFPENTIPPTGDSPPVYSPNNSQSRQIQPIDSISAIKLLSRFLIFPNLIPRGQWIPMVIFWCRF